MSEGLINIGVRAAELKEHDAVLVKNPTSEDFSWKFNGELYTVKTKEIKSFSKFVALHLAKHLSTKMIVDEATEKMTKKEREDKNAPIHGKISQLGTYDTPERRIALFKILENIELAEYCVTLYPFKGFVGDMEIYKQFVENYKKESKA